MGGEKASPFERLRKDVYAHLGKFKTGGKMVLAVAVFRWLGTQAGSQKVASQEGAC